MTAQPTIHVKGIKEGLKVILGTGRVDDLIQLVETDIQQKFQAFRGSRVVLSTENHALTQAQLAKLQTIFAHEEMELWAVLSDSAQTRDVARLQGLAIRMPGSQTDLDGNPLTKTEKPIAPESAYPSDDFALIIKDTIRGGRSIQYEGTVLIMGDVNAGSEVVAGGDVIVWGRLRGLVHAGAYGNSRAVICALELTPTQLRIADQIAIPPKGEPGTSVPEKAMIRDGQIIAEPWHTK